MKKRQTFSLVTWIVIAVIILTATVSYQNKSPKIIQANSNLLISAATSLKEVIEEVKPLYPKNNLNINYNFGASGSLQQQIENGAPVDIFISAAQKQMDALESKNLIVKESRHNLLTNQLVLISPKNSIEIKNFRQLIDYKVKKIAIGEPKSVPAGQYAEEVFIKLGILEQVKPKFVLGNNVRQVLSAVETGNADAGIVYLTDAKTSKLISMVAVTDNLHSPIVYPIAIIKNSKNINAAEEYIEFLSTNQAKAIFKKYGFGIIDM